MFFPSRKEQEENVLLFVGEETIFPKGFTSEAHQYNPLVMGSFTSNSPEDGEGFLKKLFQM